MRIKNNIIKEINKEESRKYYATEKEEKAKRQVALKPGTIPEKRKEKK